MRLFVAAALTTLLLAADAAKDACALSETCFLKGERVDGMNRLCYYDCASGGYVLTVSAASICPVSVRRDR